jgi:hypothetical protein
VEYVPENEEILIMDCLHSMAPNDEELLGFALGEEVLPASTKAHLDQCEICQQRLARFKQVNSTLVSHLYRRLCPSALQISLYCAELLPADERMQIAAHVLTCPLCTAEVADTRRFMEEVPAIPEYEPESVTGAAVRRFIDEVGASLAGTLVSPRETVRRIYATLVRQQARLVLRNGSGNTMPEKAWPRQYRAESIDISLHLSRASNGEYMLLGILTSADSDESVDAFEGAEAELYPAQYDSDTGQGKSPTPLSHTLVDDLGNIVFKGVPIGEYSLIIRLPGQKEVVIDNINVEHG